MTCKPKKNPKTRSRAFMIMLIGILMWMLSGLGFPGSGVVQLAALLPIVSGLQYLIRYELSDFSYIIEDCEDGRSELIITKTQGQRVTKVAQLELDKVCELFPRSENPDYRKTKSTRNRFNYCQNPDRDSQFVILFDDGEGIVEVLFEPDESFRRELLCRISPAEISENLD